MGTSLRFHGDDTDVVLDDATITLQAGGDPVVLLRSEVTGAELQPATLLAFGRLVLSTRDGARHTVQFPRDAQADFTNLRDIVRP